MHVTDTLYCFRHGAMYALPLWFYWSVLVCQDCHDKHQRLGCLSCRNLLSHSSGSWKPKTKMLAGLVSSEDSLLDSDGYLFAVSLNGLLSMHVYPWCPCLLWQEHQSHWISISPLCLHLILITSLKTQFSKLLQWRLKLQHIKSNVQCI